MWEILTQTTYILLVTTSFKKFLISVPSNFYTLPFLSPSIQFFVVNSFTEFVVEIKPKELVKVRKVNTISGRASKESTVTFTQLSLLFLRRQRYESDKIFVECNERWRRIFKSVWVNKKFMEGDRRVLFVITFFKWYH